MFDDPLSIAAALAGAVVAVVLLVRLDWWRAPPTDTLAAAPPKPLPTGYASTAQPTAAPVLFAVAAALVGVGLALTASGLGPGGLAPLAVGVAVLLLAFVILIRGRAPVSAEVLDAQKRAAPEDDPAD